MRIRKGIDGREFWRCCLQACVGKATTVEDQLEAVRGDITTRLTQLNATQKRWWPQYERELEKRSRPGCPPSHIHGCSIYASYFKILKSSPTFWELIAILGVDILRLTPEGYGRRVSVSKS